MSDPRLFELARLPLKERASRIAEMFANGIDADESLATTGAKRRAARTQALKETHAEVLSRRLRALGHWLSPRNFPEAALALARMGRDWLTDGRPPSPSGADGKPEGFCGRASSLAPDYLIEAYSRGLSPRNLLGALTLWSPPSRSVLRPWDFPRGIAAGPTEADRISLDEDFDAMLAACARSEPTFWRRPALDMALGDLRDAGFAHSLEVRNRDGDLIAGLIGVAAGGVFTIERIFGRDEEALARGVNHLASQLQRWNFALIDVKAPSELAIRLRCATMTRAAYSAELASNACGGRHGRWRLSEDLRRTGVTGNLPYELARFKTTA